MPIPLSETMKRTASCRPVRRNDSTRRVTFPFSSTNLRALDKRFISICLSRMGSPTYIRPMRGSTDVSKTMPLAVALLEVNSVTSSMIPARSNGSEANCILPLSILETSRMSLTKESWNWEARAILSMHSLRRSGSPAFFLAIAVRPMMALMGVRISWDMRDKKTLLARLASSACSFLRLIWNVAPPMPSTPINPIKPNVSPTILLRCSTEARMGKAEMDTLMPPSTSPILFL